MTTKQENILNKREKLRLLVREAIEEGACNWDSYLKSNRGQAETDYTERIWKLLKGGSTDV